jgi:hypothetical protein
LNRRFKGGRFPSASGASVSDAHNSTTLGRNRIYHIGSQKLQPEQTPQGATLEDCAGERFNHIRRISMVPER